MLRSIKWMTTALSNWSYKIYHASASRPEEIQKNSLPPPHWSHHLMSLESNEYMRGKEKILDTSVKSRDWRVVWTNYRLWRGWGMCLVLNRMGRFVRNSYHALTNEWWVLLCHFFQVLALHLYVEFASSEQWCPICLSINKKTMNVSLATDYQCMYKDCATTSASPECS